MLGGGQLPLSTHEATGEITGGSAGQTAPGPLCVQGDTLPHSGEYAGRGAGLAGRVLVAVAETPLDY